MHDKCFMTHVIYILKIDPLSCLRWRHIVEYAIRVKTLSAKSEISKSIKRLEVLPPQVNIISL